MNLLIDGNNLAFRAAHVPHSPLVKDGVQIGLSFKIIQMISILVRQFSPSTIYIAWDKRIGPQKNPLRQQLCETYKDNRDDPENHEHVWVATTACQPIFESLGFREIYPYSLECDDVLAWISSSTAPEPCTIVSNDKDFLQLVDNRISIWHPNKKTLVTVDSWDLPVPIEHYRVYRALVGDMSDNIAGVPKVGPKRAVALTRQWFEGSVDQSVQDIVNRNLKVMDLTYALGQDPHEGEMLAQQIQEQSHRTYSRDMFTEHCRQLGILDMVQKSKIDQFLHTYFGKLSALQSMFG